MSALPLYRPATLFLGPGEIHASAEPTQVSTILGSCVAVCLWDPVLRAGGMNHIVLARGGATSGNLRYGDAAITALLAAMVGLGAPPRRLMAKVFGGGAVLPLVESPRSIGMENVRAALSELRRHRIPVIAESVGGCRGMLVRFDTGTGEVLLRRLGSMADIRMPPAGPPNTDTLSPA